ncbi:hypothetical protein ACHAAC_06290 [Aeromicrobium sp. CF4.19]|uniref:hypothetical protein n=1 Tax=Aeromicrobium sp. CF4.19 TaxID=3373082 RepID=UPI003EE707D3
MSKSTRMITARRRAIAVALVIGLAATSATAYGANVPAPKAEEPAHSDIKEAPGPFSVLLPPPEIDPDSPAAKQYLSFKHDLTEKVDAHSLLADQVKAHGYTKGWAGTIVDTENNSLTVHWKGEAPAEYRDSLAKQPYGVRVDLKEGAKFSRIEEKAAVERVVSDERAENGWNVVGAGAMPDGSGIKVYVTTNSMRSQDQDALAETAQVDATDVKYEFEERAPTLTSRSVSNPPWRGGIRTESSGEGCTSGYAALLGSAGRLLSAAHCRIGGSTTHDGRTIATASNHFYRSEVDLLAMDPSASPATQPKVYVGHWSSSQIRGVRNWSSNNVGDDVCGSGATLGTKCGKITMDDYAYPGLQGSWYIRARNNGLGMVAQGDSGGPVYDTYANGEKQARGIILAGHTTQWTCQDRNSDAGGAQCFSTLIYLPISVALNKFGYSLEVD